MLLSWIFRLNCWVFNQYMLRTWHLKSIGIFWNTVSKTFPRHWYLLSNFKTACLCFFNFFGLVWERAVKKLYQTEDYSSVHCITLDVRQSCKVACSLPTNNHVRHGHCWVRFHMGCTVLVRSMCVFNSPSYENNTICSLTSLTGKKKIRYTSRKYFLKLAS